MNAGARVWRALERLGRRTARRRAVQEFRRSLALIVDPEALEASVSIRIQELFDPERLAILRLDRRGEVFRASSSSGFEDEPVRLELPAAGRLARWFLVNETPLLLPRDRGVLAYLSPAERRLIVELELDLCAPLLAQNQLTGMVLLGSARRPFDRHDAELLKHLADQASLAFQNAALYREQQERLDRLHRADRLAAMGQLAAGVAHEVRNPLTAIRSTMQYLGTGFAEDDPKRELTRELIGEVDRIDGTISDLLSLARPEEYQRVELDLVELVRATVRLIEIESRKRGVRLEESYSGEPLRVLGDPARLKQLCLNLILNALQATPEGGRIRVEVARLEAPAATPRDLRARLRVSDTGVGISAERLSRVFDPFFTTKSEGTGMGLAICHSIVERHGGEIALDSREGEGTTAAVTLPLAP